MNFWMGTYSKRGLFRGGGLIEALLYKPRGYNWDSVCIVRTINEHEKSTYRASVFTLVLL